MDLKKLARFWRPQADDKVNCRLCPWSCVIAPRKVGVCKARRNEGGKLYSLVYGSIVSMAVDPIEKKPLYHFWPGSNVFSVAVPGCNFHCGHCQNWTISQVGVEDVNTADISPEMAVELIKRHDCKGIAFTYTEPTIATEYAIDVGKLAHKENLYTVYVSNGYITLEALEELRPHLDAANVDVKGFTDAFYRDVCGVPKLRPVLDTCEWMAEHGIHLETTYLIIPGKNDDPEELRKFCRWEVDKLGPDVPTHFSRFFPHYKTTDREPTPVATLELALRISKEEGLNHVYVGNVPGHEGDNTHCKKCGELLIERYGFDITYYAIKGGKCPNCGTKINVVGEYLPKKRP